MTPTSKLPTLKDLEKAFAEISVVLEKYDIGAALTLVSPTHTQFIYHLPPWGVLEFLNDEILSINLMRQDYPSEAARLQKLDLTLHYILQVRDCSLRFAAGMQRIIDLLVDNGVIQETPNSPFAPSHITPSTPEKGH